MEAPKYTHNAHLATKHRLLREKPVKMLVRNFTNLSGAQQRLERVQNSEWGLGGQTKTNQFYTHSEISPRQKNISDTSGHFYLHLSEGSSQLLRQLRHLIRLKGNQTSPRALEVQGRASTFNELARLATFDLAPASQVIGFIR